MEKMIDVAVSKGDLNSVEDLHMYCAAATAACNLEYLYHGHTVLEYLTGEVPRSRRDVATIPEDLISALPDGLDSDFVSQIQSLLHGNMELLHLLRDDDARYSALLRDAHLVGKHVTKFTLKVGDKVSYDGNEYTLVDIPVSTPTAPVRATVRTVTHSGHEDKDVLYSDLRPLTDPRPVHMHGAPVDAVPTPSLGDFVFFSDVSPGSSKVLAGVVTNVGDDSSVTVHEHKQADAIKRRFTPLYLNTLNSSFEPKLKPQPHHCVVSTSVPLSCILAVGTISATYHITDALLGSLTSFGVLPDPAS